MKFIVCVKQVPEVAAPIYLREGEIAADSGRMVMNAYDASAVEASLVIKEKAGGEVSVVLVGPQSGQETLRKALAMGADDATHLLIDNTPDLDSRAYAELLADYIRSENFDVIACGKQAQDTDAGLTGCMLAELLDLPYAANAVALDLEGDSVVVIRQGDSGQEEIRLETPCLVTCSNDMNDPRIPNLKGIMAAKRKIIQMRQARLPPDIQLPIVRVRRFEPVSDREPGRILEGETNEVVATLVNLLQNESGVL